MENKRTQNGEEGDYSEIDLSHELRFGSMRRALDM